MIHLRSRLRASLLEWVSLSKNSFAAMRFLFFRKTPDTQGTSFGIGDAKGRPTEASFDKLIRIAQELRNNPFFDLIHLPDEATSDSRHNPELAAIDDRLDQNEDDIDALEGRADSLESRMDSTESETSTNTTNIANNRTSIIANMEAIARAAPSGVIDAPHVRAAWSAIDTGFNKIVNDSVAGQDDLNLWAARQLRAAINRRLADYERANYPIALRSELESGTPDARLDADARTIAPATFKAAVDTLRTAWFNSEAIQAQLIRLILEHAPWWNWWCCNTYGS